MRYSEKLNSFWEEGYHYYIEIRDSKLTLRRYDRVILLETDIAYDADALERGERTVITLSESVYTRAVDGEPMSRVKELAYENGELTLLYIYLEKEETLYRLHRVDHGPFDHIIIRDEEYLDRLQGVWEEWSPDKKRRGRLIISGNILRWEPFERGAAFHVISYRYNPNRVLLIPESLTSDNFSGFSAVEVRSDMLITKMIVYDMDIPDTVFARRDKLDTIIPPPSATKTPRNTMTYRGGGENLMGMGMGGGLAGTAPKSGGDAGRFRFCPGCGKDFGDKPPKFCTECGTSLRK